MNNSDTKLSQLEDCTTAIFQALETGDTESAERAGGLRDELLREIFPLLTTQSAKQQFLKKQKQIQIDMIAVASKLRDSAMSEASSLKRGQKGVSAYKTIK